MVAKGYAVRRTGNDYPLWRRRAPLLSRLDVELTERCNNACVHCYINLPAGDRAAAARELSTEAWQEVLREAAGLGALSVRFTGGEPLLRPDFAELYLFARCLGLKVQVFTNARLITPELADLWSRVPPLEKIEVTVYGMRAETYEAVSAAPGSYAESRRGVDLLLAAGVPFVLKGTRLPANKHEQAEFEAWLATLPWQERVPSYVTFLQLRGRRDSPARNRAIAALRLPPEEGLSLLADRAEEYRRGMASFCRTLSGPRGATLFDCGAGRSVCVDAYGVLQPCMGLRDPALGYALRSGSLHEALTVVFPRLRERNATNPAYLARCVRCFLGGLCEQCPARSWAEHGTLDTPVEYLCQVAHAKARLLGLLAEGERAWEVTDAKERIQRMEGMD